MTSFSQHSGGKLAGRGPSNSTPSGMADSRRLHREERGWETPDSEIFRAEGVRETRLLLRCFSAEGRGGEEGVSKANLGVGT